LHEAALIYLKGRPGTCAKAVLERFVVR